MRRIKLKDKQFDGLDVETRRSLMVQLMLLSTPKYDYALGANGKFWTLVRYDGQETIGADRDGTRKYMDSYEPEIVDSWL